MDKTVKDNIRPIIKTHIDNVLSEMRFKMSLRKIIKEAIKDIKENSLNEKDEEKSDDKSIEAKRNTVMNMLQNDKLNNSKFAYELYDAQTQKDKDTARSLFSKKVNGTPDADGNVRKFSDKEIAELFQDLKHF